jgi:hypothetical protein
MNDDLNLNGNEWLALNYALAVLLSDGLTSNQMNILGNFLCAVGQNMLLLQAWLSSCPASNPVYHIDISKIACSKTESSNSKTSETLDEKAALAQKIADLEGQLTEIKNALLSKQLQDKPNGDADRQSEDSHRQKDKQ